MHRHLGSFAVFVVLALPATAGAPSLYAGLADWPIRALPEAQRDDLLAGRGMGLALAAYDRLLDYGRDRPAHGGARHH